jgi:hypothetical protein
LVAPSKRAEFALQVNMRNCKTDDDKRKRTDDGSIEILDEELVCVIRIPEKEFKTMTSAKSPKIIAEKLTSVPQSNRLFCSFPNIYSSAAEWVPDAI